MTTDTTELTSFMQMKVEQAKALFAALSHEDRETVLRHSGALSGNLTFSEYIPEWEHPYLAGIIHAAIKRGYSLSVYDGEEWTVKHSKDAQEIASALGSTGEDSLAVHAAEHEGTTKRIGAYWLIYNNGSKGDPEIVVADYTHHDGDRTMDRILADAKERAGIE